MDQVQKLSNCECCTPSSEPIRIYYWPYKFSDFHGDKYSDCGLLGREDGGNMFLRNLVGLTTYIIARFHKQHDYMYMYTCRN
jgi:hypothetical protein